MIQATIATKGIYTSLDITLVKKSGNVSWTENGEGIEEGRGAYKVWCGGKNEWKITQG